MILKKYKIMTKIMTKSRPKNRKNQITRAKIEKIIFCKKDSFRKCFSDISSKKQKLKTQFLNIKS